MKVESVRAELSSMDQRKDEEDEVSPSENSPGGKDEDQSNAERESPETGSDSGRGSFKRDKSKDDIIDFKSDSPSSAEREQPEIWSDSGCGSSVSHRSKDDMTDITSDTSSSVKRYSKSLSPVLEDSTEESFRRSPDSEDCTEDSIRRSLESKNYIQDDLIVHVNISKELFSPRIQSGNSERIPQIILPTIQSSDRERLESPFCPRRANRKYSTGLSSDSEDSGEDSFSLSSYSKKYTKIPQIILPTSQPRRRSIDQKRKRRKRPPSDQKRLFIRPSPDSEDSAEELLRPIIYPEEKEKRIPQIILPTSQPRRRSIDQKSDFTRLDDIFGGLSIGPPTSSYLALTQ